MNQTQKPSPYMDPIVTRSASTKGVVQQDAIEKKARRLVKFASEVVLVQKSGVKLEGSSSLGIDRNGNKTDLGLLTTGMLHDSVLMFGASVCQVIALLRCKRCPCQVSTICLDMC